MTFLDSIILGLVQGLTEFLPVSSSGHLVLVEHLLGSSQGGLTFEIWLHLATLCAVVVALRRDLFRMLQALIPGSNPEDAAFGRRWILATVVGTLPAVAVGLFLKDAVESVFASVRWVGIDLLVTAVILFLSRFFPGRGASLTPLRAFAIGCAQAVAIMPGISRAGSTLTAGLAVGLSGIDAARFSFILSLPAILGAVVLELSALADLGASSPAVLAGGFVTAALSGYAAIRVVWKVMENRRLALFAPYCALLGLAVLLWGAAS